MKALYCFCWKTEKSYSLHAKQQLWVPLIRGKIQFSMGMPINLGICVIFIIWITQSTTCVVTSMRFIFQLPDVTFLSITCRIMTKECLIEWYCPLQSTIGKCILPQWHNKDIASLFGNHISAVMTVLYSFKYKYILRLSLGPLMCWTHENPVKLSLFT